MPSNPTDQSIQALREKLNSASGPRFWRSLEEVAETEEFEAYLHAEFPAQAEAAGPGLNRRSFLKLMGASLALAGAGGCTRQPDEYILPYTQAPEHLVPGNPMHYASAFELSGTGRGVLVESHMGRPTKIEGNPDHPASLGGSDALGQASVLELYDPDRSQVTTRAGEIRTWDEFTEEARRFIDERAEVGGRGLRLLTGTVTSPALAAQISAFLERYPKSRHHAWDPINRDNAREASQAAFGQDADAVFDFTKADVVVSLGSDFLTSGAASVRYHREFSARRRTEDGNKLNRLYVAESTPTTTGSMADHRVALKPSALGRLARRLAAELGLDVPRPAGDDGNDEWISALAKDLRKARGRSLVIAGDEQPASVQLLAHAINDMLGNVGKTVRYIEPVEFQVRRHASSMTDLVADMRSGDVDALLIIGGNPCYDAPADLDFTDALSKVPISVHVGTHNDETAHKSLWHIPMAHYLESWSDTRAFDGTASIVQPLIEPLYDGKTATEVLAAMAGRSGTNSRDLVREYWLDQFAAAGDDAEAMWRKSLHDGFVAGTAASDANVKLDKGWNRTLASMRRAEPSADGGLEVCIRADANVHDGRFSNNGWMQELPRPISRISWDNAVLISPATAERLSLATGDEVELISEGRKIRGPVWVQPGQAEGALTVHLGYGRTRAGHVGNGVGFDAYPLRSTDALWHSFGTAVLPTGTSVEMITTQDHHSMEGRDLVRTANIETFKKEGGHTWGHGHGELASMFPDHEYDGNAWGMTIDLGACSGCNACTIACQAENNISVVGKDQVAAGREMHWIRVDRYFEGDLDEPEIHHQPVPCMHCEKAPCEVVCPVNATVHSDEGLNDMVYNRCVGTRYCSNNCPYKVRRFNFHLYSDFETETLALQRNPEVTVRSRGVMEKCTYCVQRIQRVSIEARREGREIEDGEIKTACQSACPAQAITFGDINNPDSEVAKAKSSDRNYSLLEELGTKPRTTYLAAIRNPNPALDGDDDA